MSRDTIPLKFSPHEARMTIRLIVEFRARFSVVASTTPIILESFGDDNKIAIGLICS